jgi:hypothetical protein
MTSQQADDKFVLDYSKRRHSSSHGTEVSREDMVLKGYQGELEQGLKNLVGPAFLLCGTFGFFKGIVQSARTLTFKNRPKKLIITSLINTVGKQSSFHANAGAALGLLYCLTKRAINFLFEEDLANLNDQQKQAVYGFTTGALFKSTRGLYPAILNGILVAGFCGGTSYLNKKYKLI